MQACGKGKKGQELKYLENNLSMAVEREMAAFWRGRCQRASPRPWCGGATQNRVLARDLAADTNEAATGQ